MRQPKVAAIAEVKDAAPPLPFEGCLGISIDETCDALNLGRDKVYELIAVGEPDGLTASQIGRRTIVHVASIHRLLQRTIVKSLKLRVPRERQVSVREFKRLRAQADAGTSDAAP